jgi:hypothetical protein
MPAASAAPASPPKKARATAASPLWDRAEISRWRLHQGMVSEAVVQEAEWVKGFNEGVGGDDE